MEGGIGRAVGDSEQGHQDGLAGWQFFYVRGFGGCWLLGFGTRTRSVGYKKEPQGAELLSFLLLQQPSTVL